MDKQTATMLLDSYMQRPDSVDLDDRQQAAVIRQLRFIDPADADEIIFNKLKEKENQMFRPTPSTQQNPTSTKPSEATQIITHFLNEKYWERVAPLAIPPITEDGTAVRSAINWKAFLSAIHENTVAGKGKHPVRHDILSTIVINLDQDKLLEHFPQTVERVVEVEKPVPLTAVEVAKRDREQSKKMNASDAPAIKGVGDSHKQASQQDILAEATRHAKDNESANNIIVTIGNHRGKSRGATEAEKEILETIVARGREAKTPWATIEAQVNAQVATMRTWDATQAIRVTMAEKAAKKGINLLQRTPNKYGVDGSAY